MDTKSSEIWSPERFPLRVLLVESDDSTRRIITALLRKCSYKVVSVSDGLKAWETLKARPQNFDLILTEVDLPSISGYALLTLVMEDDICKRIPVIMTSSQDSISMVLKCTVRGAADYLVKPIRRNELTNLWQHVWRRLSKTEVPTSHNTTGAKHEFDASCEQKPLRNDLTTSNVNGGDKRKEESLQLIGKSLSPSNEIGAKRSRSELDDISHEETYRSTVSSLGEDLTCAISVTSDASECPLSDLQHGKITGGTFHYSQEIVQPPSAIDYISKFEDYSGNINECYSAECDVDKLRFAPYLELSLRKPCPTGSEDEGTIEQQRLYHSNASAFSRFVRLKSSVCSSSNCSTVDDSNSSQSEAVVKSLVSDDGLNHSHTLVQERLTDMDSHSPLNKEAALLKFQQKRKDICLDEKVRYQSRKRAAVTNHM